MQRKFINIQVLDDYIQAHAHSYVNDDNFSADRHHRERRQLVVQLQR